MVRQNRLGPGLLNGPENRHQRGAFTAVGQNDRESHPGGSARNEVGGRAPPVGFQVPGHDPTASARLSRLGEVDLLKAAVRGSQQGYRTTAATAVRHFRWLLLAWAVTLPSQASLLPSLTDHRRPTPPPIYRDTAERVCAENGPAACLFGRFSCFSVTDFHPSACDLRAIRERMDLAGSSVPSVVHQLALDSNIE